MTTDYAICYTAVRAWVYVYVVVYVTYGVYGILYGYGGDAPFFFFLSPLALTRLKLTDLSRLHLLL